MAKEISIIFGLSKEFEEWIKDTFGAARSPLDSLMHDDDWTFVIKMHAFVEAGLNHLLLKRLGNEKLANVLAKMETNARSGKLAFIRAYDLLPEKVCRFVEMLASVRNRAVHDVTHLDMNLADYVRQLKPQQLKEWRTAMTSWDDFGEPSEVQRDDAVRFPRHAIFSCVVFIIANAQVNALNLKENPGQIWIYERTVRKPKKSIPKKS